MNTLTQLKQEFLNLHGYTEEAAQRAAEDAAQVEHDLYIERETYILECQARVMDKVFNWIYPKF